MVPINFYSPVVGIDLQDKTSFLSNRHWVIAEVMMYDRKYAKFYNHADELEASWLCSEIEYVNIPVLDSDSPVILAQKSSDYQAAVKKQRPNAWSRWTTIEDEELLQQFSQGLDFEEIADIHKRTPVAIHDRLLKLGVDPGKDIAPGTRPEKRHYERLFEWKGKLPAEGEVITVCLGCGHEIRVRPCKCWHASDTSGILTWREHQWIYSMYGAKIRRREF